MDRTTNDNEEDEKDKTGQTENDDKRQWFIKEEGKGGKTKI